MVGTGIDVRGRHIVALALGAILTAAGVVGAGQLDRPIGDPDTLSAVSVDEGERLIFSDLAAPDQWDLFHVGSTGHDRTRITTSPGLQEHFPSASPDGRLVAFEGRAKGPEGEAISAILVASVAGGAAWQVSSGPHDTRPAWDPLGHKVVYASHLEGQSTLALVNSDGSERQVLAQLDHESATLDAPAFSPDGRRIAFVVRWNDEGEIWSMNPDGSDAAPLLRHPGWDDRDPAWSADGARLAFVAEAGEESAVWILETATGIAGTVYRDAADLRRPTWSTDGRLAVERVSPGGSGAILLLSWGTAEPGFLTAGQEPQWFVPEGALLSPTPGTVSPTTTPAGGVTTTPSPPAPTFPPPPPTPRPFPTFEAPGPTATGPAPTYPRPTSTPTSSPTASATATSTSSPDVVGVGVYLPACANRPTEQ